MTHGGNKQGFTLVEALIALALAGMVIIGFGTYLSSTLQSFTQQEDTLTGSRDAQILLSYLRDDLTAADGFDSSATLTTGTTFPKSQVHLSHSPNSEAVQLFIHTRSREPNPPPGLDPIRDSLPPVPRTLAWLGVLNLGTDVPLSANLPAGSATNDLLRSLNYGMNAVTWSRPVQDNEPRFLFINRREGPTLQPVIYTYFPAQKSLRRTGPKGETWLVRDSLRFFSASPYYEFLLFPEDPSRTAELLKVWFELTLVLQAPGDGGKIAKRTLDFSTRITPRYLNSVIKSRWGL